MEARQIFMTALGVFLTGVLKLGLVRRERIGFGRIGFESAVVLVPYAGAVVVQVVQG